MVLYLPREFKTIGASPLHQLLLMETITPQQQRGNTGSRLGKPIVGGAWLPKCYSKLPRRRRDYRRTQRAIESEPEIGQFKRFGNNLFDAHSKRHIDLVFSRKIQRDDHG